MVQKDGKGDATYELLEESGPDHSKRFVVQVLISGKPVAKGEGKSKKEAQKMAAYNAILMMKNNPR